MFGMVVVIGIKILFKVDFYGNCNNFFIVVISIGVGMIFIVVLIFFDKMLYLLGIIFYSGILLVLVMVVGLNLFFNGWGSEEDVVCYVVVVVQSLDY